MYFQVRSTLSRIYLVVIKSTKLHFWAARTWKLINEATIRPFLLLLLLLLLHVKYSPDSRWCFSELVFSASPQTGLKPDL